jgi:hypothetical protein
MKRVSFSNRRDDEMVTRIHPTCSAFVPYTQQTTCHARADHALRVLENKLFRFARLSPSAYARREDWYYGGRI